MNPFSKIKNFIGFLRSDEVSTDAKALYLVVIYCCIANAVFVAAFFANGVDIACRCIATGMFIIFLTILYLLNRFDEIYIFKYVIVFVTNFICFPLMFYLTGNIVNGAILFFPLGIVFTFFLIKSRAVYPICAAELIWYTVLLTLSFVDRERFLVYNDVLPSGIGIPMSFIIAAFMPIFIFIYQTDSFERTKKELNESRHIIDSAKFNKSRFLANVTHEIRTPMNAIIGMNELILREELDPDSRELAENIKSSSNQLLKIINNILEFSKLDSNKMELYPAKYDFRQLMTEIIDAVSNEYAEENTEFLARIDPNIPRTLFGDNIRIKQVFMYLLFSTVHKLPHSRMSMEVTGETDINTNTVLLKCTIAESGFGLSEVEIEAMLSAYTKFDSRQKSDFKGMGLELSICKEILELMGGSLSIKSVKGVGMSVSFEFVNYIIEDSPIVRVSTVKDYNILIYTKNIEDQDVWLDILGQFQLYPNFVSGPNAFRQAIENRRYTHIFIDDMFYPMLKDTIKSAQISNEIYVLTEAGSIYSDFGSCKILRKPMTSICVSNALNNAWDASNYKVAQKREAVTYPEGKIIIVDDSIVNLKVLEGMLQTFMVNITKCRSGAEALDILDKDEFDLIILDQRMPEMDGIELLHLIRKLENANALAPVLCATADFGPEVSRMLLNEGFQDYLAKPVRRFYLERMLRKYMPPELAVNIVVDEEAGDTPVDNVREAETPEEVRDPLDVDFKRGLDNIGGLMEAYASVVNAYYSEGLTKLEKIPALLAEGNIRDYVTEVHALKSSSAAIGADAMSALFKELEFAGKASNMEFIESHSPHVLETFESLLGVVKDYLISQNAFEEDRASGEPEGEVNVLDPKLIDGFIDSLTAFNIKETENGINECCRINFGSDINKAFREIKASLDVFDYHKAKELLTELGRRLNESGI